MRVLVIKTSSLGDILHTLPALTDAARAIPGIRFDWVLEESFAEIPRWHPAVEGVLPLAHRRWRKNPLRTLLGAELRQFIRTLRESRYDRVIDAQGLLIKSVWIACSAKGKRYGMDWSSAREPIASLFYRQRLNVPKQQHAVERLRQLFAQALDYPLPHTIGDYGIDREQRFAVKVDCKKLVFLHGTSWITKEWPESYWAKLIHLAGMSGYHVHLTWGNAAEQARAEDLARGHSHVVVLNKMGLGEIAREIASAAAVVAVDTGLGHLAAALAIPTVSIYGPTSPALTGAYGLSQQHITADFPCAPCFRRRCHYQGARTLEPPCLETITPGKVWQSLCRLLVIRSVG